MTSQFSLIDWLMIASLLIFFAYVGFRARARSSSVDEFLVMGRRLGPYWGLATLAAAETGLVTFVYFAQESYLGGFSALMLPIIGAAMMFFVGWNGFVVKKLRELEMRTVPEFLETHFSPGVRSIAGLATFVVGVLNMGIFLQVEATFLAILMGIPERQTLVFMAVLLIVVVAYTVLGGMYCVVLTDVVQFVMIVLSAGLTTWIVIRATGGWHSMTAAVSANYGRAGFEFWKSSRYGTLFLSWTALYYLSGWSTWQPVVARVLSMKDINSALKLFRVCSMFMFLRGAIPMIWGIGALVILGKTADSTMSLAHALVKIMPSGHHVHVLQLPAGVQFHSAAGRHRASPQKATHRGAARPWRSMRRRVDRRLHLRVGRPLPSSGDGISVHHPDRLTFLRGDGDGTRRWHVLETGQREWSLLGLCRKRHSARRLSSDAMDFTDLCGTDEFSVGPHWTDRRLVDFCQYRPAIAGGLAGMRQASWRCSVSLDMDGGNWEFAIGIIVISKAAGNCQAGMIRDAMVALMVVPSSEATKQALAGTSWTYRFSLTASSCTQSRLHNGLTCGRTTFRHRVMHATLLLAQASQKMPESCGAVIGDYAQIC